MTIAIPAHNEARRIGECLDAVIAEIGRLGHGATPPPWLGPVEILVIDNASSDSTAAIAGHRADAAAAVGASLRVVGEPRKGLTLARRCGHRQAREPIVAWIDADTRMPPGWIERVWDSFEAAPDLVCVSGPYRYHDQPAWQRALVWLYWRLLALPCYWWTGYLAVGGNFAVRRIAVDRIGGFDPSIEFWGEDTDIARRLAKVGRVRFRLDLAMPTSARRLAAEGLWRTGLRYAGNFVSEVIRKQPLSQTYRDIR
ncbi:MAG: glycosyltransferase family A protein [Lautropia sp.]